jgi:cobalt/nickel transport system ATP-binding protein
MTLPLAVEIASLRFIYPDGRKALETIELNVREGERLAIIGANGAGKTTLLLHINGILRGEGAITVFGIRLDAKTLPRIRAGVGFVFQNPDDQLFCPTLFEDVAFGPRNLGLPEEEVSRRVKDALRTVGLAGQEERAPFHLSVGEKKRAALATVLSMDTRLLVLDEPSSNLDPRGRRELAKLLGRMPRTMIIATHDMEFARTLCTRAVVMNKGQIVDGGDLPQFLDNPSRLHEYGL